MEKYYRMVIDLYKEVITTNYQVNSDRILEVQTEIANASTEALRISLLSKELGVAENELFN